METVKAKIKGTNAILEGCVCDDSFFVSVDHDIFERYSLCEVEICKDSLQAQETCKENGNSFTDDLEEAAKEYEFSCYQRACFHPEHKWPSTTKDAFIAGAEWQKEHLTVEDIKTILDISFWNNDPEKILDEYNRLHQTKA